MSTHTADMLKLLQQLPLEIKIEKSKQRIIEWYEHYQGQVYISFSGGKDSTVLLHLAREIYKDIEAVFVDTGLEYNQIRDFVKTFENVTWLKPKMRFDEVIAKYGYPIISKEQSQYISQYRLAKSEKTKATRLNGNKWGRGKISETHKYLIDAPFLISDACCNIMKKSPIKIYEKENNKKAIIGTMAEESEQRKSNWIKDGCNSFNGKRAISKPLSFWTEQDVLNYLLIKKIKYCEVYGDIIQDNDGKLKTTGQQRTGCVFCGFGAHLEKSPNRYEKLKEIDYKKWDYCMRDVEDNGLGFGKVLDYINVKWGKDDPNDYKLDGFWINARCKNRAGGENVKTDAFQLSYQKTYYQKHKKKILKKARKEYIENKKKILQKAKKYYQENKTKILENNKNYYKKNKVEILRKKKEKREAKKHEQKS